MSDILEEAAITLIPAPVVRIEDIPQDEPLPTGVWIRFPIGKQEESDDSCAEDENQT